MSTILVIEDNTAVREEIVEILGLANYTVLEAVDGKEGILLAEEKHPDLIICDLTLPILDGFVVLQVLNNNKETSSIPFIFLTSRSDRAEVRRGMDLGADDYITKPFESSELLNSIECRLKKSAVKKGNLLLDDPLQDLIRNRNIRYYKNKQLIYQEGNHPSCLFYILKGKVKTFKVCEDGRELITALYNEGFLGHVAIINKTSYHESAEAVDDVELAVIPNIDFDRMVTENNYAQNQLIKILAQNVDDKEGQLLKVAYDSLRKKTADTLLAVNKKYNNEGIRISRSNLAALAGVAKESFARTLSDFRDEQLIDIKKGVIFILDVDKLSRVIY